ncbi:MAG TPA: Ig-like domain-containing protein, partial [Ruminiclostridium sp.]|nr:Ig-like domain-containing protein [Ruminiclostridium sp.]
DTTGVKSVTVYVNGTSVGNAKTGLLRPDVDRIINTSGVYKGAANSGYSLTLNTSSYSPGTYTVKVISTGNGGAKASATTYFKKPSPYVCIDTPGPQPKSISTDFKIQGWSLNPSGVKDVQISIDGNVVGSAVTGISRPDVDKVMNSQGIYPAAATSGFSYLVDNDSLSRGQHTFTVTSVGNDGTKSSSSFSVNVVDPSPLICLDVPQNLYLKNGLTVNGWSLNKTGIKSVDFYIGSTKIGSAETGLIRNDVNTIINSDGAYKDGDKSGFSFAFSDISSFAPGNYTLKAVSTGFDGTTAAQTTGISRLGSATYIDSPAEGDTVRTDFNVSGWAVSAEGVKEVQVYIDGVLFGNTQADITRNDVRNHFIGIYGTDGYKDSDKSGYSFKVNIDSLNNGSHNVTVKSIGQGGSVSQSSDSFKLSKIPPNLSLDYPGNDNPYMTDSLTVKGWAISAKGVENVAVYIDNDLIGNANLGLSRPDVGNIYSGQGYLNAGTSGYSLTVSGSALYKYEPGKHTVKVVSTGNNGDTASSEAQVIKSSPAISADGSVTASGDFKLSGWAINASGVSKVDVYYGSVLIAETVPNLSSPDITALYDSAGIKYAGIDHSRFSVDIPIASIPYGNVSLTLKAIGNDGSIGTGTASVMVNKPAPNGCIDTPVSNYNYSLNDSSFVIAGWTLNATGVKSVSAYLDGNSVPITYGLASDSGIINLANGKYAGAENARFKSDPIDLTKLSFSAHTVKIVAIGNDNGNYEFSTVFYRSSVIYSNYSETLSSLITTQLGMNPGPGYYLNGWKYIQTTPGVYYYYKWNADGSTTYTKVSDPAAYQTIYNNLTKYIDPQNLVGTSSADIYQFMKLTYLDGVNAGGLNTFFNSSGVLNGMGQTFIDAGKNHNVNPVYLAMHSIEETGNGTSLLAKGVQVTNGNYTINGISYTSAVKATGTYYNLFGIGAGDGDVYHQGIEMALKNGWNSVPKAIDGGANWISYQYINTRDLLGSAYTNQNTLYKMRWNPEHPGRSQYATDILWAHNSAVYIKQYFDKYTSSQLVFDIPVYQ